MQIVPDIRTAHLSTPAVITVGNFDGVHRGHQTLLRHLSAVAAESDGPQPVTAIVTFDPHPLAVLRPDVPLKLLTTPHERLQIAAGLGIDIGVILPFTRELAALEPRAFLALLKQRLGLSALVVGPDFALGRGRTGNLDVLAGLAEELDYRLVVLEPIAWEGKSVRSNVIRQLLTEGEVDEAAALLGRLYHVSGIVQVGDRLGHQLGIPTANFLETEHKLRPGNGVYATRTWLQRDGRPHAYQSVTNIGVRPTVNGALRRLETHILDFPPSGDSGDLYGQELTVEFLTRLRGEQKFTGVPELVAQIHADIDAARRLFASAPSLQQPFFLTPLA